MGGILDHGVPAERNTFMGMSLKHFSLITLTFQNSALILILHYSRMMVPSGDHRYFTSTAVFLNEVVKLLISLTLAINDVSASLANNASALTVLSHIYNAVFSHDHWRIALPATLYILQNTLLFVAVGNLDAVHYQVLYQLKILTTALFSVLLLRRALSPRQWTALVVLTAGVVCVSLPSPHNKRRDGIPIHDTSDHFFQRSVHEIGSAAGQLTRRAADTVLQAASLARRSATYQGIANDDGAQPEVFFGGRSGALATPVMNYAVGVTAVLTASVASGMAGVTFERVLKDKDHGAAGLRHHHHATAMAAVVSPPSVTLWIRNIQLSFYSLFPAIIGIIYLDGADIAVHGFFDGYSGVVWSAIILQAVGGLLASLCIRHADNIAKNFATSFSIIISFLTSALFTEFSTNSNFLLGTSLVMGSIYLYNTPPSSTNALATLLSTLGSLASSLFSSSSSPSLPFTAPHARPILGGMSKPPPAAARGLSSRRAPAPIRIVSFESVAMDHKTAMTTQSACNTPRISPQAYPGGILTPTAAGHEALASAALTHAGMYLTVDGSAATAGLTSSRPTSPMYAPRSMSARFIKRDD